MKKLLFLLLIVFAVGCQETTSPLQTITVAPTEATTTTIAELADDIQVIPLQMPEDMLIGEVNSLSVDGGYLFLSDRDQTGSLTAFNADGTLVKQLKGRGNGPGEYTGIELFAADVAHKQVYIYDLNYKAFLVYSFPELKFQQTLTTNKNLVNMCWVNDRLFTLSDEKVTPTKAVGAAYFSPNNQDFTAIGQLPKDKETINSSESTTLLRNRGHVLYACPQEYTTIYEITDTEQIPLFTIDFGKYRMPSEYWEKEGNYNDYKNFIEILGTKPYKACWVRTVLNTDKYLSFYYTFADKEYQRFAVYNKQTKEVKNYNQPSFYKDKRSIPYPLGADGEYYLSIIYDDDIDELLPEGTPTTEWERVLKERNADMYLLKYKLKNATP